MLAVGLSNQGIAQHTQVRPDSIQEARNKIAKVFLLVDHKKSDEAIKLCVELHLKAFYEAYTKNFQEKEGGDALKRKIDDMLFEASLEFLLNGEAELAKKIQDIIRYPPESIGGATCQHLAADACYYLDNWKGKGGFHQHTESYLEQAADDKERNLKVTPYFLGTMYENAWGFCGKKDDIKAAKYLALAKERDYEPKLRFTEQIQKEYVLMLAGEESVQSTFYMTPLDINRKIILDRIAEYMQPESTAIQNT